MLAALVYPRIQGADLCGHIIEVGRNVKRTRIGEPVRASALMQDAKKFKPVSMLDNGFGT